MYNVEKEGGSSYTLYSSGNGGIHKYDSDLDINTSLIVERVTRDGGVALCKVETKKHNAFRAGT